MKANKSILVVLLSVASLIGGIWGVVSVIREKNQAIEKADSAQNSIDLSKVEVVMEGEELTKKYSGSTNVSAPEKVVISISSELGHISFNKFQAVFGTSSDSIFNHIGNPERFKSLVSSSSTYIFDSLGFYMRADTKKSMDKLSIYFKLGELDVAPKSIYSNSIIMDGVEVNEKSSAKELISKLKLGYHPLAPHNYIKETSALRVILNFNSPNEELVNVLIEAK